jgi:hypothetical protein
MAVVVCDMSNLPNSATVAELCMTLSQVTQQIWTIHDNL